MKLGRKPIIREAIMNISRKSECPLRFSEIAEKVAKELHRERKDVHDQNISDNLSKLVKDGDVEETTILDKKARKHKGYYISNASYVLKSAEFTKSIIGAMDLANVYNCFVNKDSLPLTAYSDNLQELTDPRRKRNTRYFSIVTNNWNDPLDVISRRMLESYVDLDFEEKVGIAKLLANAYWFGVQSLVKESGRFGAANGLLGNKQKALEIIERLNEANDQSGIKREEALIQILDITAEILDKKNLRELLLFFREQDFEIKKLQNRLQFLNGEPLCAGEAIYDRFKNFHHCTLKGVKAAGVLSKRLGEPGEKFLTKFRYFMNYSNVWDKIIFSIISQFMTNQELEQINSDLNQTLAVIKELERYLNSLMNLIFKCKTFVVYFWGYPEIFDISKRNFISKFEEWLSAVKKGYLDNRSWIFSEDAVSTLIEVFKRVKKGKVPPQGLIDFEPWTIWDLYFFHPRGKDESFWSELLTEIKVRLQLLPDNRQLCRHISATLEGGY